jgi:hypothetical protein
MFEEGDTVRIIDSQPGLKDMAKLIGHTSQIKRKFSIFYELVDYGYVWKAEWLELVDDNDIKIEENDLISLF